MILQSLKEYYDRKASDPESGIAPEGWEWREIPFIVVLDEEGSLVHIEDTREGEGNKKRGKSFLVPQGVKKTSGVASNLLWDTAGYVFGAVNTDGLDAKKAEKALQRAPEQKAAFIRRIEEELLDTKWKKALLSFLIHANNSLLAKTPQWDDIYRTNPNMSFRFDGEYELYCRSEEVVKQLSQRAGVKEVDGRCLITGEVDTISPLHTSIKGVWGAQSSGANIVSFNLEPFRSYGKAQGWNAPVGDSAMFAYTTSLNTLLGKDSTQRLQVGDASTVFWSLEKTQFEESFASFFAEPDKDDPDAGTQRIRELLDSPKTGAYREDSGKEKFFILGLAPNAARISIRFWLRGTVADFAETIRRHFEDLRITKPPGEPEYYSLWRILVNIAVQDKSENIPPNMAGDFMRTILEGKPYPQTILQAALRRIKSDTERRVKPVRAALLKAFLNRYMRAHPNKKEKEIEMALDTEQPSMGYQLGRLFAVLEKVQEDAKPGLNSTIGERYYGAACSSPVTVFPTLLRLNKHHLVDLKKDKEKVAWAGANENRMKEIFSHIDDFPAYLNLHEQGKFAIGYYHQRQDFFTKKEEKN